MDRYEEALERAKAGKPMDEVFPELKESEDERILNALITHISIYEGDFETVGVTRLEMLSWLEKQKPVKIVRIPKFRVGDIIQHVPLEKWDSTKKIISIDEHGYNYNLSHLGDTVSGGAIGFAFENEYELVEQKPAGWSEEDKERYEKVLYLIEHFDNLAHEPTFAGPKFTHPYTKEIAWLKSLRPQQKQDGVWITKEQFEQIKSASYLTGKLDHWKPSEEQMDALEQAKISAECGNFFTKDGLKSLYEQLKKL